MHLADSHGSCIECVFAEFLRVAVVIAAINEIKNWTTIHMIENGMHFFPPDIYLDTSKDPLTFKGCKKLELVQNLLCLAIGDMFDIYHLAGKFFHIFSPLIYNLALPVLLNIFFTRIDIMLDLYAFLTNLIDFHG